MGVAVKLEMFEGPLDLLLHLIRKSEVDIYDIPIALITRQYLDYLELMREMNIGVAGEFLVMAATLTHIKSRMLLPSYDKSQDEEEDEDPRATLVERLREHMRIKGVVDLLERRSWLDRDVFTRQAGKREVERATATSDESPLLEAGLFELIDAFRTLMASRQEQMILGLEGDEITLEDRMGQLLERLRRQGSLAFHELFKPGAGRSEMVVSFLALLELTRVGLIRVYQERSDGPGEILAGEPDAARWSPLRIYFQPGRPGAEDLAEEAP